jgi:hypothetical protein
MNVSVKLLMNWDIKPGRDQDYFEFVVREWMPGVTKLGIETVAAWYTVYSRSGDTAQIMAEAVADDLPTIQGILKSQEWLDLHGRLMEYVSNYDHKVVRVSGDFQL